MEGNAVTSREEHQSEEEWDLEAMVASAEVVEEESRSEEQALTVQSQGMNYNKNWIFDSGCSDHMTGDKENLNVTTKYKGRRVVVTANNTKLPIAHVGNAIIASSSNAKDVQLEEVYHVPGIKKNLISITQLTAPGNYVVFGPKDVKVCKEVEIIGTPIMEGIKKNSMYVMSAESACIDSTRKNETADLWHARLGHVGYHKLKVMMKKSMLKGLPQLEECTKRFVKKIDRVSLKNLKKTQKKIYQNSEGRKGSEG
ncbi:unnamed protein product [Linum tenue]|uniref:GAG-pre-integrase domain-containing protein n=1 Tax=Linum tenue TaxID=586396 RepID=A0AAV0S4Y7_9ROSI|nr:unnamed protein product [Linum tenue]